MDVDVYGECGNLLCPRSREESCRRMVGQKYKFYLSLENSLCLDYVTEKYFSMMQHNVVPIVLSLQGSHAKLSPPHSFINAMDFSSVRRLADYLKEVDANDTKQLGGLLGGIVGGLPILGGLLPNSPQCVYNNNCQFLGLNLYVVLNILDPVVCGNEICTLILLGASKVLRTRSEMKSASNSKGLCFEARGCLFE